jgi:hypothetical protein
MKDEIRKINDSVKNFKQFSNENSIKFDKVFKTIKKYIDFTLKTEIQINNYVPNTHIADDIIVQCSIICQVFFNFSIRYL